MTAQETFTCDGCGGTFAKGWTDAEADAEAQTVWGGVPQGAERGILCDDCWDKLPKPGVRRLKLQLYAKAAGQTVWVVVKPALHPGDPAGSISTNGPAGRDLLVFGMDADGRGAHVSRSVAGVDADLGDQRGIVTEGLEELMALEAEGELYERTVVTDIGLVTRVRWVLES
jgi:hypothetical protein